VVLAQVHSGPSLPLALARLVEVLARSEVEEQQVYSVNQPTTPPLRPHLSLVNPQRRQARQTVHLVARIPYSAVINLEQVRLSFFFRFRMSGSETTPFQSFVGFKLPSSHHRDSQSAFHLHQ